MDVTLGQKVVSKASDIITDRSTGTNRLVKKGEVGIVGAIDPFKGTIMLDMLDFRLYVSDDELEDYFEYWLPVGSQSEQAKKPIVQGEQWKKEGKCPECGEEGTFVNFALTCSKHGTYS